VHVGDDRYAHRAARSDVICGSSLRPGGSGRRL
jgi:hypothetical protein